MGRVAGWGRSRAHACEHGPQRSLRAVSVRAPARGVGLASRLHLCRLQGRACACGCECELGDERAWACRVSVPVARECESPACCAPGCGVGGGEEAPGTWSGPPGERPRAPSGVTTQRASGRPTPLPARPGAPGSLTFTSHRKGGPPGGGSQERGRPGSGGGRASRRQVPGPLPGKSRDVYTAPGPAGTALAPTPHTTAPRDGHAVTPRAAEGTGVGGPGSLPGGVWFVAASACRRPGGLSNGHSIPSLEAEVQGHGAGRAPLPGSQTAVPSLSSPQFPSVLSAPCLLVRTPVRSD